MIVTTALVLQLLVLLVLVAMVIVASFLVSIGDKQATIPITSTQQTSGLNPRHVVMGPYKVAISWQLDGYLVDVDYTVTDAGITTGEEWSKAVDRHRMGRGMKDNNIIKKDVDIGRGALPALSAFSNARVGNRPFVVDQAEQPPYKEDTPTTETSEHSFYRVMGPFPGGANYFFEFQMTAITDVWGAASAFEQDIGIELYVSMDRQAKKVRWRGELSQSPTEQKVPVSNGFYFDTISNWSVVKIDNNSLTSTGKTGLQRAWNEMIGESRDASVQTDLGVSYGMKHATYVSYSSAPTTLHYVWFLERTDDVAFEMMEVDPSGGEVL
jgi:hypothetical protein